jgi:hypothetical protein
VVHGMAHGEPARVTYGFVDGGVTRRLAALALLAVLFPRALACPLAAIAHAWRQRSSSDGSCCFASAAEAAPCARTG